MREPININVPDNISETTINTYLNDPELKKDVYDNIIYPFIKKDIDENIKSQSNFRIASLVLTIFKYICLVAVPIFSLSAPYFSNQSVMLSYISGSLASLSLGFERLAKLCFNISKQKEDKINNILKKLKIDFKLNETELKETTSYEDVNTPKRPKNKFNDK